MASNKPKFTNRQREHLKQLGLCPAQIDEVERTLALSRALLQSPPTMNSVRDELSAFQVAIDDARKVADKLSNSEKYTQDKIAARKEAQYRIQWVASEVSDVIEALSASLAGLETLGKIVKRALDDLPKKQRRQFADFRPVARIDHALLDGFIKAHKPPFPPYILHRSSSPGSTFRKIVGICYEAMGWSNDDPERAIKSYLRVRNKRKDGDRGTEQLETAGGKKI